jgi:hypothetical protein
MKNKKLFPAISFISIILLISTQRGGGEPARCNTITTVLPCAGDKSQAKCCRGGKVGCEMPKSDWTVISTFSNGSPSETESLCIPTVNMELENLLDESDREIRGKSSKTQRTGRYVAPTNDEIEQRKRMPMSPCKAYFLKNFYIRKTGTLHLHLGTE